MERKWEAMGTKSAKSRNQPDAFDKSSDTVHSIAVMRQYVARAALGVDQPTIITSKN